MGNHLSKTSSGQSEQRNLVKVSVGLPGSKRQGMESYESAIERVINDDLKCFRSCLDWSTTSSRSTETFFRHSPTYGIRTRYSRTVFTGDLTQDLHQFTSPAPEIGDTSDHIGRGHCGLRWRRLREARQVQVK